MEESIWDIVVYIEISGFGKKTKQYIYISKAREFREMFWMARPVLHAALQRDEHQVHTALADISLNTHMYLMSPFTKEQIQVHLLYNKVFI